MLPQAISGYQVIKKIATGGMGEVFLAKDTALDRLVVLKFLPKEFAMERDQVRRFAREAKAISKLNHPNIAHIYGVGEADGTPFIAMEYIEGETLHALIARGPLSPDDVINYGMQLADTLQNAHLKGIIHRDIKPANLMITQRGDLKVLDFGLAKITTPESQAKGKQSTATSKTGIVLGTTQYMSPEQALGAKVDHRSDLFSSGVVLYEMSTGRRPFPGENRIVIFDRILHAEPPPISDLIRDFPPELEKIILRCLRKDAFDRYLSASELLADLKTLRRDIHAEATSLPLADPESLLPRPLARLFFVLLQVMYMAMYVSALRWLDPLWNGLAGSLNSRAADALAACYLISAMIGIAARLYFISLVALDHRQSGIQYRKAFPFLFCLDILWALAPISLSARVGEIFALACVPLLVFAPFAQRTLMHSAYDFHAPKRIPS